MSYSSVCRLFAFPFRLHTIVAICATGNNANDVDSEQSGTDVLQMQGFKPNTWLSWFLVQQFPELTTYYELQEWRLLETAEKVQKGPWNSRKFLLNRLINQPKGSTSNYVRKPKKLNWNCIKLETLLAQITCTMALAIQEQQQHWYRDPILYFIARAQIDYDYEWHTHTNKGKMANGKLGTNLNAAATTRAPYGYVMRERLTAIRDMW